MIGLSIAIMLCSAGLIASAISSLAAPEAIAVVNQSSLTTPPVDPFAAAIRQGRFGPELAVTGSVAQRTSTGERLTEAVLEIIVVQTDGTRLWSGQSPPLTPGSRLDWRVAVRPFGVLDGTLIAQVIVRDRDVSTAERREREAGARAEVERQAALKNEREARERTEAEQQAGLKREREREAAIKARGWPTTDAMSSNAAFWTAVAALAASVSACLAAIYTWLTYRLVKGQTEPNVVTYVRHDESRASVLQIIIENIGRGLAIDVSFTPSRPIPARAFGLSAEALQPPAIMTDGPLIMGIPALGPGDTRKIAWGQYPGLKAALGDDVIELVCRYRGHGRRVHTVLFKLDVRSFAATDAVPSDAARITTELERIAKAAEALVRRGPANEP